MTERLQDGTGARFVARQAGATWHVFDQQINEPLAFTVGYGRGKATFTADFLNQQEDRESPEAHAPGPPTQLAAQARRPRLLVADQAVQRVAANCAEYVGLLLRHGPHGIRDAHDGRKPPCKCWACCWAMRTAWYAPAWRRWLGR